MRSIALLACVPGAVILFSACTSSDPAPARTCVPVDTACAPLYEPKYSEVFERTLKPSCGREGASCHASQPSPQKGIALDDADAAYDLLLKDARGLVVAGDPSCSLIINRITSSDGFVRMPPGRALQPAETCAIVQWIAAGAKR